jgi:hypothetical protein
LQNESVPNVLIRDLPPEVHAALVQRANESGQSLQQYLVGLLSRAATTPTPDDVLRRLQAQSSRRTGRIGFARAAASVEEGRGRSDRG